MTNPGVTGVRNVQWQGLDCTATAAAYESCAGILGIRGSGVGDPDEAKYSLYSTMTMTGTTSWLRLRWSWADADAEASR